MDLFDNIIESPICLIQSDGEVNYHGALLTDNEADRYFDNFIKHIEWKNDEAIINGERIITKRKVAWYGDSPYTYTYSKTTKLALPWTTALLELKSRVETATGETFNSCLLNLYHNGSEGMAWHSDSEASLKKHGAIASLSLGDNRKFSFKHKKTRELVSLELKHGSLLVMKGATQTHWLHRLPPTKQSISPRINLTFRTIVNQK